ncbi:Ubiquitin fusion degradation protein UFD1 [Ophiocordyceps camponoti-floridani]|uniref:Ubiquitin fusion degradation protein UFD1 n=1 Tax=Ophiocordyceps camponoti-floridani TaxID=2030778 RepID=A0A8H4Q9A3_9HYPO|nr:Ubiquitin fusion degradation protein UFD1 [Ophiocordyceps camponoti-floridani]
MDVSPLLNWSATYDFLPVPSLDSKLPAGDKMILPQSALEQLLAASPPSDPLQDAHDSSSHGSNPYYSGFIGDDSQQLPHPLMFRLLNPANGKTVYAGIREFSAPEGTLTLSPFLSESLGLGVPGADVDVNATATLAPPSQVVVVARQLPKGTYARLRPLEAGYNPDDWRSLLERHLRMNLTCLTKDAVLSVPGVRGETFQFRVDKIAPDGDGICVVDTDLEVDIEALDEEQARETLRRIISKEQATTANGSSEGGELMFQKTVQGHVSPGAYVDYQLRSWDRSRPLTITLSGLAGEDSPGVFVTPKSTRQRALPRDSVHVYGHFGAADHGVKSLSIEATDAASDSVEFILISVHSHRSPGASRQTSNPINFELRAHVSSDSDDAGGQTDGGGQSRGADEERCDNCLRWVPKRTMVLHANFCRRNNVVCPKCQTVFVKGSPEWEAHWHCDDDDAHGNSTADKARHDQVFHGHHDCPSCEFSTNSLPDLARHRTSVCPGKLILCRFCHLEVAQGGDAFNPSPEVVLTGMTAHELQDGARTTECHLCDKIVRLRDMETHLKHHELDKVRRSKPPICRNANCGRTLDGVGPRGQVGGQGGKESSNDMGLCSPCFGPLYVSLHDPDGKALRRRIERRYLGQLMSGCGKSHCGNVWCKTGRANSGQEPRASSVQAVLPLVKPLVEKVPERDEPMFFCVDEASQRQRTVSEMVAAEKGWELAWCVAAAEAEKGDVNKMREWLQAWAPRR